MKAYRCKHRVEAMRWTDTDEDREKFSEWLEKHGAMFETNGRIAPVRPGRLDAPHRTEDLRSARHRDRRGTGEAAMTGQQRSRACGPSTGERVLFLWRRWTTSKEINDALPTSVGFGFDLAAVVGARLLP